MVLKITCTPEELKEIASLYHNLLEREMGLYSEDKVIRTTSARYLTKVNIPQYRGLLQEVRDALNLDVNQLEESALRILEKK